MDLAWFLTGQCVCVCVCVAAAAQQVAMGYSNSTLIRQRQLHLLQQQQHLQAHNAEAATTRSATVDATAASS
ncbi:hypothetical protein PsorP6_017486 [Peronosclerospora sorghi]|uniref:Uncharacterized protein n=1 Tax=Peronosclerospora sorghi TaxID=230839 RepID=A0ACC0WKR3_9STRA|nr:hypothetical protein PsorP6_017486 [Peronosclerospora sorghi]